MAAPRKITGRLDIGSALGGWLRVNTGSYVHGSMGAASVVSEAAWLRDFVAEPLGAIDVVQDKFLR